MVGIHAPRSADPSKKSISGMVGYEAEEALTLQQNTFPNPIDNLVYMCYSQVYG